MFERAERIGVDAASVTVNVINEEKKSVNVGIDVPMRSIDAGTPSSLGFKSRLGTDGRILSPVVEVVEGGGYSCSTGRFDFCFFKRYDFQTNTVFTLQRPLWIPRSLRPLNKIIQQGILRNPLPFPLFHLSMYHLFTALSSASIPEDQGNYVRGVLSAILYPRSICTGSSSPAVQCRVYL